MKDDDLSNVEMLKKMLSTVLQLLRNITEQQETVLELNSLNRFSLRRFIGSDTDIQFWTGFYSSDALQYFVKYLVEPNLDKMRYWGSKNADIGRRGDKCGPKRTLDHLDELFLTLVKLRQGSANADLAERFHVSEATVSRIFLTWVRFLEIVLTKIDIWVSKRKVKKLMPDVFKDLYRDVVIIVDCTEMECERPFDLEAQAATYSHYKSRCTVKALVGLAPHGVPTFISDLMEGSISDNEITMKSGLIRKMERNTAMMADRGWTNKKALEKHAIRLVTPAFLMDKKQLELDQIVESVAIARVRIHVERYVFMIFTQVSLNLVCSFV